MVSGQLSACPPSADGQWSAVWGLRLGRFAPPLAEQALAALPSVV